MKRKALGKGLKAFIPEEYAILKEERYTELDIDQLQPNPLQPRLKFSQEAIQELAQSIKESGVLQPVVVVPEKDHYRIIVGERRWRAAQKIGLKKIPALIRTLPKKKQLEISLVENLQREDLNPLEIALAYQKLIQELNYTQQEIAEKVGKDRSSVANSLRLLKLPQKIQGHLAEGRISMGHARALLSLEEAELQISLSQRIVRENLSVRQAEKIIQRTNRPSAQPKELSDPDLRALQEEFLKILGTKVSISGTREKGMIKVYYFSMEDLNRIHEKIKGDG
ncbi:MAG: ParB/RepB/Spo0J family partition protein [Candidatus Aminicenantes bacterium]